MKEPKKTNIAELETENKRWKKQHERDVLCALVDKEIDIRTVEVPDLIARYQEALVAVEKE